MHLWLLHRNKSKVIDQFQSSFGQVQADIHMTNLAINSHAPVLWGKNFLKY